PKGSGKQANFVNSLWIGGLDAGNQLRMAAMTYRQKGFDFWPGPLDTLNATTDSAMSAAFDRVWKIDRQEIESFVNAWQTGSVTAGTYSVPGVIQTWPGNGNTALGFAKKLAPFVDADDDGVYNPMKGD